MSKRKLSLWGVAVLILVGGTSSLLGKTVEDKARKHTIEEFLKTGGFKKIQKATEPKHQKQRPEIANKAAQRVWTEARRSYLNKLNAKTDQGEVYHEMLRKLAKKGHKWQIARVDLYDRLKNQMTAPKNEKQMHEEIHLMHMMDVASTYDILFRKFDKALRFSLEDKKKGYGLSPEKADQYIADYSYQYLHYAHAMKNPHLFDAKKIAQAKNGWDSQLRDIAKQQGKKPLNWNILSYYHSRKNTAADPYVKSVILMSHFDYSTKPEKDRKKALSRIRVKRSTYIKEAYNNYNDRTKRKEAPLFPYGKK